MGGRWRLRFAGADGLDHHVVGQVVLLRRVGGYCLGGELRLRWLPRLWPEQPRVVLILPKPLLKLIAVDRLMAPCVGAGVNAHLQLSDISDGAADLLVRRGQHHMIAHLVGGGPFQMHRLSLSRYVGKAVQLLPVCRPEDRR